MTLRVETSSPTFTFEDDTVQVPAEVIALGLGLRASAIQSLMRNGEVTSYCEKGVIEDAGRYRLTFFHKSRRFQFIVEVTGKILQRRTIDFGDRALPTSLRKPGL